MGEQARLVELPDGTQVWARLSPTAVPAQDDGGSYGAGEAGGFDDYDSYEDVGALDHAAARVLRLRDLITGIAASVRDAAAQAAPDEVSVEFGVEFAVRSGAVISVLADAESCAGLKVTLTWRDRFGRGTPLPRSPVPPPMPAEPPRYPPPPATAPTVPPPAAPPTSSGGPPPPATSATGGADG